jgi:uncharacterized protein
MEHAIKLPEPVESLLTKPFWDACRAHKLSIQRCDDCGKMRFYPTAACPFCACENFTWAEMSGRAKIYSWTRVERTLDPAWAQLVPYVSVIAELEEQEHLLVPGLLLDSAGFDGSQKRIEVCFEPVGAHVLPRWRLAE